VIVHVAGKGEFEPLKKRIEQSEDTVIMLVYTAIKNMANLKLEN